MLLLLHYLTTLSRQTSKDWSALLEGVVGPPQPSLKSSLPIIQMARRWLATLSMEYRSDHLHSFFNFFFF